MEAKIEKLRTLISADVENANLKSELRGAIAHLQWVRKWKAKYAEIYNQYFKTLANPR